MKGGDFVFSLRGTRRDLVSLYVEVELEGDVRAQLSEAEAHDLAQELSKAAAKILAKHGVKLYNSQTLIN